MVRAQSVLSSGGERSITTSGFSIGHLIILMYGTSMADTGDRNEVDDSYEEKVKE